MGVSGNSSQDPFQTNQIISGGNFSADLMFDSNFEIKIIISG